MSAAQAATTMYRAQCALWCLHRTGAAFGMARADYAPMLLEHEFAVWQAQEALAELGAANDSGSAAA